MYARPTMRKLGVLQHLATCRCYQQNLVAHAYEGADGYKQELTMLEMKWDSDGWPLVDPED